MLQIAVCRHARQRTHHLRIKFEDNASLSRFELERVEVRVSLRISNRGQREVKTLRAHFVEGLGVQ